ncbi:plasmid partition protein ParG [Ectothiorhodospira marina]|uniref:ParG protein n=1 Tax=Ectothiorhodospira marina TaxID=1396821 RepID=A0A1H7RNY8_9GAMM|nr:plasmid partition protein ParG [Ectothiorhodospira marina]SEL61903.1 ParG protein [Ectothiorhodospira marina]
MSTKKVTFTSKPTAKASTPDEWVQDRTGTDQPRMKRLTIDIPEDLHRRLKMDCAANGTKMADVVREMISQKYGKTESSK